MSKLHKIVATTAFVGTVAVGGSQIADADTYTIKSGDTLSEIAEKYNTTVEKLAAKNNIKDIQHLIEHFSVLPCHANCRPEFIRIFLKLLNKRRHLNCLWTCSENQDYIFLHKP